MWKHHHKELDPLKNGFVIFIIVFFVYGTLTHTLWLSFNFLNSLIFALVFAILYLILSYAVNMGMRKELKKKTKRKFFPKGKR